MNIVFCPNWDLCSYFQIGKHNIELRKIFFTRNNIHVYNPTFLHFIWYEKFSSKEQIENRIDNYIFSPYVKIKPPYNPKDYFISKVLKIHDERIRPK